jgi:predicted DNA-binding protein
LGRPEDATDAYGYHMAMARTQTLVQLSDELLQRLDSYRAREGRSRSEVVREAIERYLAADREAEIDRLIVDAYQRQPPDDVWNEQAAKQMISAEPW